MNTKALITTLAVLGSTSSLAMARPVHDPAPVSAGAYVSWNAGAGVLEYPAPIVRDHGYTYTPPARVIVRPVAHRRGDDWGRRGGWGHDRDRRGGWGYEGYEGQPRATLLADGLTYNPGEYRKDIVLEGRGRFNAVTLHEDDGCNFINNIVIEFMGGAVQSIPVNRTLQPNQSMTFDLDGTDRAINRIFVYRAEGPINVGRPSGGEFAVTAL
jgi:hypothetical protein